MTDAERTVAPQAVPATPRTLLEPAARAIELGLPALGLVQSIRVIAVCLQGEPASPLLTALLDGIFVVGAYSLAGFVLAAALRSIGAFLTDIRTPVSPSTVAAPIAPLPPAAPPPPQDPAQSPAQAIPSIPDEESTAPVPLPSTEPIRRNILARKWDEAEGLLFDMEAISPEDPRLEPLRAELRQAREAAREEHLSQLDAARGVNDPERVLELHGLVAPLMELEARHTLEADLSRWMLRLIHNRLRTGKIQADLVELAGRIAEAFCHTPDGASLRASLPTLRRSAGLCPRCAKPYLGLANACPECLARAQAPDPVRPIDEQPEP